MNELKAYWQSMLVVMVFAFGLSACGCGSGSNGGDERRIVCSDEFESPWSYNANIDSSSPTAWWTLESGDDRTIYHIPSGVSCSREIRDIIPESQQFVKEDGGW